MFVFIIKEIRLEKDIALVDLAEKTGISQSYLWYLENNQRQNPNIDVLYKIAEALNVNIKKIFFTGSEIEPVRKRLHKYINRYGLHHPKTFNLSHLLDVLINIKSDEINAKNNLSN